MLEAPKAVFTSPKLLLPILLEACFIWGTIYLAATAIWLYLNAVLSQGSAFTTMVMQNTDGAQAVQNGQQLNQIVNSGFLSIEALGAAIIVAFFVVVAMLATAYTKALVLGALKDRKASVLDMFRSARAYWWQVVKYYAPLTVLIFASICIGIYALEVLSTHLRSFGGIAGIQPAVYWLLGLGALIFIIRSFTLFADGVIVGGSRKPLRDSFNFARRHKRAGLLAFASLLLLTLIVYSVDTAINAIPQTTKLLLVVATALSLIAFFVWRLLVAAFVVALWRRTDRG